LEYELIWICISLCFYRLHNSRSSQDPASASYSWATRTTELSKWSHSGCSVHHG